MTSKKYLFLFTIGPVQTFIAQARKTQDLYAGSQLLADLVATALSCCKLYDSSATIIYPHRDKEAFDPICTDNIVTTNESSYPNRMVCLLEDKTEEQIINLGNRLEEIVKKSFKNTILNTIKAKTKKLSPSGMEEQIEDLLQIYWTAVPYNGDKDYASNMRILEQQMAIVKNCRQFGQVNEDAGRKCHVSGEQNIKFYRKNEEENRDRKKTVAYIREKKLFNNEKKEQANNVILDYTDTNDITLAQLQPGEGLSTISFFKRLYRSDKSSFPSTASIALMHLNLEKDLYQEYKKKFKGNFDEQLLFDENLRAGYFDKYGITTDASVENLKAALTHLQKNTSGKFTSYYALVRFDGDSISSWLKKATTQEQHKKFSELLLKFAEKAKDYIDRSNYGRTVYAGGDDFLGFINLNHLFKVTKWIKEQFEKCLTPKVKKIFELEGEELFTCSMGIVIAHYKTPLHIVVDQSKALEKEAKEYHDDKNSTGLCFMNQTSIIAKSLFQNKDWHILTDLVNTFVDKKLSPTFVFQFARQMRPITTTYERGERNRWQQIYETEFKRLFHRAICSEEQKNKNKEPWTTQLEHLRGILRRQDCKSRIFDIDIFFHFMKLATKISSEIDIAIPQKNTNDA